MSAIESASVLDLIEELANRERRKGLIHKLFPDKGPHRRELYPKHLSFFAAGNHRTARLALCANGIGKTLSMGGFEIACHLTGQYPPWWNGYRYKRPPKFWIAGKTKQTTRDNQQSVLLGRANAEKQGGGLIPTDAICFDTLRRWPQGGGLVESVQIQHASGGKSYLGVRSYDQPIDAWYGENLDGGWMDEPAELLYYTELYTRTRGSEHPLIALTFTPLKGSNDLVEMFIGKEDPSRAVINCTWDEVPHLSESWKREKLANTPAYMQDTVSKGIPALGVGAVYPIPESDIIVDPFEIPAHWPRAVGFDGGWHNTAAIWGAWDRDTDTWYLYAEHKAGELLIPVHVAAIKSRGDWIPVVGDVYSTNQTDGKKVVDEYRDNGLKIKKAEKLGKDARIEKVRKGLAIGKIKVFKTLAKWRDEYRIYHYDDHGKITKENDHLMDATQHLIDEGPKIAKTEMQAKQTPPVIPGKKFGRRI